jgi:hypothetical protein
MHIDSNHMVCQSLEVAQFSQEICSDHQGVTGANELRNTTILDFQRTGSAYYFMQELQSIYVKSVLIGQESFAVLNNPIVKILI